MYLTWCKEIYLLQTFLNLNSLVEKLKTIDKKYNLKTVNVLY